MVKRITILYLLIFAFFTGMADDQVRFVGTAKQIVKVGERFRVTYEINEDADNFTSPQFGSLQVLSGPSTSTNSSVQWINGKMSQSYTKTYTFVLQATETGDNTISPATVFVDGKRYRSNSLKINVIKNTASSQNNNGSSNNTKSDQGVLQDDDVYIKATVNNLKPYLGEQVIITYRIYTRVPVSNLMVKKLSSFSGFWSKNLLENKQKYDQTTEVINGDEYVVAVINQFALFPQKTGKLKIDPAELECTVQLRVQNQRSRRNDPFEDFFNDPFFNRNIKNVNTVLKSNSVELDVLPLPQEGKPASFDGAVGDFQLNSSIDRTTLTANDALTLSYTIKGSGNLELLNLPEPNFPPDFETYDPKISSNINTSSYGISGRKKFEYLAIPRYGGEYTIEPVTFSYFDPKDKKYHTLTSEKYQIDVEKGDNQNGNITYSASAQEDIQFIGQDIQHIKTLPFDLREKDKFFFLSNLFYLFLALPIIVIIVIIIVVKNLERRKANVSLLKNRKANKMARNRLRKAEKLKNEGNDKAYYDEIAQALWGYIADKFNLKQADLSIDSVSEMLKARDVDDSVSDTFINTLNNIEFARFAPGDSSSKMESIYNESVDAILLAEKALK